MGDRADLDRPVPRAARRPALRRLEAAPRAGRRRDAPAAGPLSRRADRRASIPSRGASSGTSSSTSPAKGHPARDHALHGRGRALRPGRLPLPVEDARRGRPGRADEAAGGDAGGDAARRGRLRAGRGGGDGRRRASWRTSTTSRSSATRCTCWSRRRPTSRSSATSTPAPAHPSRPADRGLARGRLRPPDAAPDRAARRTPGSGARGGAHERLPAVLKKEAVQMIRDKGTLRFALLVPAFQLVLFGLIDTNVRHVPRPSSTRAAPRRAGRSSTIRQHELLRRRGRRALARGAARGHRRGPRLGRHRDPARLRAAAPERRAGRRPRPHRRLGLQRSRRRRSPPPTGWPSRGRSAARRSEAGARPSGPRASAPALQPRLAQRQPAHPRPRRDPADLLGHPARRLRDRARAGARHARAAHGHARLARRGRARQAPPLPRASPSCS